MTDSSPLLLVVGGDELVPAVVDAATSSGHVDGRVVAMSRLDLVEAAPEAGTSYVLGDTDPIERAAAAEACAALGLTPARPIVHAAATVGSDVELGPGSVMCAGCRVTTNIRTGHHLLMGPRSTLSHDGRVGDRVVIGADANVAGAVTVHDDAVLGSGVAVAPGVSIGAGSTVAPESVVVADVAAGSAVSGVPARGRAGDVTRGRAPT